MAPQNKGRARGSQPAKPQRRITEKVESVVAADRGMTIREEFAKAAMQGLLSNQNVTPTGEHSAFADGISKLAITHADSILAELAKDGAP